MDKEALDMIKQLEAKTPVVGYVDQTLDNLLSYVLQDTPGDPTIKYLGEGKFEGNASGRYVSNRFDYVLISKENKTVLAVVSFTGGKSGYNFLEFNKEGDLTGIYSDQMPRKEERLGNLMGAVIMDAPDKTHYIAINMLMEALDSKLVSPPGGYVING